MRMKAIAITSGAVLAAALVPGTASADPDHGGTAPAPAEPPAASDVTSELLARGSLGEFRVRDRGAGLRLSADEPTDLALVSATLAKRGETGWHEHAAWSLVVVESGTMTLVQPRQGGRGGCREDTYSTGMAFAHPSGVHNLVNGSDTEEVKFFVTYFLPEADVPTPVAAATPWGCEP
ncbi:hypothetical protein E4P40_25420 [Blastococcus sp. CT_GayMR20]|uniref:hypothetical protein n=1 Tax=Blastococcus sp. CT_GayMR20 TaxID=2559609 RepID=UPI0010733F43|nr:hypothetical protein [Blastococcus sp. CT_GayMR20]TFV66426.1 hypothetical protein E4P40_25420 [Blastococcus sp. CT_GayMR20]